MWCFHLALDGGQSRSQRRAAGLQRCLGVLDLSRFGGLLGEAVAAVQQAGHFSHLRGEMDLGAPPVDHDRPPPRPGLGPAGTASP